jgi:dihydrofolate reductase
LGDVDQSIVACNYSRGMRLFMVFHLWKDVKTVTYRFRLRGRSGNPFDCRCTGMDTITMTEIILIAAVGRQGQLGLNGGLPWGDDFKEDRKRFRNVTAGGIVISGYVTYQTIKHLDGTHDRAFLSDWTDLTIPQQLLKVGRSRTIFIAGGAKTYTRWLPYITRFDITVLPYDGPADVYMPPLFTR